MVTLSSANEALKEVYLGVVSNQLNTNTNPLLTKIKQTTADVWGNQIRKLAPFGLNGGIGAGTEDGDLPDAAGNNYAKFVLDLKNLYGKIEISDVAIRASENSTSAFVNLLNAEMEGLIRASSFNFGRMLYGDGSGKLAAITENDSSTVTVDDTKYLMEGMVVDIVSDAENTVVSGMERLRILSINRASKVVTLSTKSMVESTYKTGYHLTVQGSANKELTGLGAIFASEGELYGLDRASYNWLIPFMEDISSTYESQDLTDTVIQKAIDKLDEEYDSKVDFIVCSSGVKRNYQEYIASFRTNVNVLNLEGGFKAISYNGIPLVSDRFVPNGTMFLLNTNDFNLHQLCDWEWLQGEDGRVIKQNPNKPTYSATLVKYADIICNKPCGQAKLFNIKES